MLNYANVDRVTGKVLTEKGFESEPARDFNEPHVWLEMEVLARPPYDDMTERLEQYRRPSADISDMDIDVDPSTKLVQGYDKVALTPELQAQRAIKKISELDNGLIRIIEDLIVVIATGGALNKNSLHPSVLEKINVRRRLRGQGDV
jgi:hypothetical protein